MKLRNLRLTIIDHSSSTRHKSTTFPPLFSPVVEIEQWTDFQEDLVRKMTSRGCGERKWRIDPRVDTGRREGAVNNQEGGSTR